MQPLREGVACGVASSASPNILRGCQTRAKSTILKFSVIFWMERRLMGFSYK
jgi:hypothetical protein